MDIFVGYGGEPFWTYFISVFYAKVRREPMLRDYFVMKNFGVFVEMQLNIVEKVMSGEGFPPCVIREAHHKLRLTHPQVNRYLRLHEETLQELGVDEVDIHTVLQRLSDYTEDLIETD